MVITPSSTWMESMFSYQDAELPLRSKYSPMRAAMASSSAETPWVSG
jgi:hypothetical protein